MIEVEQLGFTYAGAASKVLKGLSFTIQKGEVLGFLGPSGAGKSTTQKILIKLLTGFEGSAHVLGRDLRSWGSDYYERIGVSFELPNHYLKLTALENLNYFRSLYAGPADDPRLWLDRIGLGGDLHLRVSQFSKGMKIRLTFVRALLHRPELLFLDEPTAGLDPVNARLVKDIVLEQKQKGSTVFLTTHDMTTAVELCDRVAFIVDGELRLIDSPRNLMLARGRRSVRLEYRMDGRVEQETFPLEGLGDNPGFLQTLRTREVQTIHTEEASLERIFIEVTGRTLS